MEGFEDFTLIHSYSRQQAIEDGVLVDVTEQARETGISFANGTYGPRAARLRRNPR